MKLGVLQRVPDSMAGIDALMYRLGKLDLDDLLILDNRPPRFYPEDYTGYRWARRWLGVRGTPGPNSWTRRLDKRALGNPVMTFLVGLGGLQEAGAVPLKGCKGRDPDSVLPDDAREYLLSGPEVFCKRISRPVAVIAAANGFPKDSDGLAPLLHRFGDGMLIYAGDLETTIRKVEYSVTKDKHDGHETVRVVGQAMSTPAYIAMDATATTGPAAQGYPLRYKYKNTHLIGVGNRDLLVLSNLLPYPKIYVYRGKSGDNGPGEVFLPTS